jgi:hypothetical protein
LPRITVFTDSMMGGPPGVGTQAIISERNDAQKPLLKS